VKYHKKPLVTDLFREHPLSNSLKARVRGLLKSSNSLATDIDAVADDADLYAVGLSSHATVNLMLGLEEAFDIEFPDRLLRRQTFSSIDAIADALVEIGVKQEAA
jgi:acyl carrier protein